MAQVDLQAAVGLAQQSRRAVADGVAADLVAVEKAVGVVQGDGPEGIGRRHVGGIEAQHIALAAVQRYVLRFDADRKSTRLNSSHSQISYAVFCLKKKKEKKQHTTRV